MVAAAQSLYGTGSIRALTLELHRLSSPAKPRIKGWVYRIAHRWVFNACTWWKSAFL